MLELLPMLAQLLALLWVVISHEKGNTDWYYPAFWSIIFGLAIVSDKV